MRLCRGQTIQADAERNTAETSYGSEAAFSRAFKKMEGVRPRTLRCRIKRNRPLWQGAWTHRLSQICGPTEVDVYVKVNYIPSAGGAGVGGPKSQ
jgi:AraC-like DNA-binding protein